MTNNTQNKVLAVSKFVRDYVKENGRGCPKGELQFVGKFSAKDIKLALEMNLVESARGSEGGLFPAGERPDPKSRTVSTLKGRMADYIRRHAATSADARSLLADYDAECAKRSAAQSRE